MPIGRRASRLSTGHDDERINPGRSPASRRPLGQVYATLSRLLNNGMVVVDGLEPGGGPERKPYAITPDGITDVEGWLGSSERPEPYLKNALHAKVVLALMTGRSAAEISTTSAPRTSPRCAC